MPLSLRTVQPVDPVLTQFLVDYVNDEKQYIANKIFPIVPVKLESGTYFTFTTSKDAFTLPVATKREVGTAYGRGVLNPGTSTYQTQEDGWELIVDRRLQQTALDPFQPYTASVRQCARVVLLRREYNVLSAITNATTFASYTTAVTAASGDRWDNTDSSPILYFDNIANTIRGNCGMLPNTCVIPWGVWVYIKNHPVILDIIKLTTDKIVTEDLLARAFHIEKLYLTQALYNSAEENKTVTLADIMSKKAFI